MPRIHVDTAKCDSFANCVVSAPDYFTIGADGKAEALAHAVTGADVASVEEAVRECPVAAIRLSEH